MTCGREFVGTVQTRGSHVDRVGLLVVPVGERRAATLAECPAHLVRRTVVGRFTVDEGKLSMGEGKPRDRLCPGSPAARDAVAHYRRQRRSGYPVSHLPTETPTLVGITAHPFSLPYSVPTTILAARRSLFAVPNLTGWNAYHGCDRGGTKKLRVRMLPTVGAEGAGIYPGLEWAARAAGSATTSCSLPPAERARFSRRSTETRGSLTPSSASLRETTSRSLSSSSLPAEWRATTRMSTPSPSWITWNSRTSRSRVTIPNWRGCAITSPPRRAGKNSTSSVRPSMVRVRIRVRPHGQGSDSSMTASDSSRRIIGCTRLCRLVTNRRVPAPRWAWAARRRPRSPRA